MSSGQYLSIFTPSTPEQRKANFQDYWQFSLQNAGELYEPEQDLEKKRARLRYFQEHPVRLRKPLADPQAFYRNYVEMVDSPESIDRLTLMLSGIYKFARHEWVGILGAWEVTADMQNANSLEDKISRVHLAEEFCHWRFFDEMLKTCGLDKVDWIPLSPFKSWIYRQFPKMPGFLMDSPAFVTELMGANFYFHLDNLFDEVLADEPEVKQRLRDILDEITIDELAHVGQRRNFLGPIATQVSKWLLRPFFKGFFNDIPEFKYLLNVEQMIKESEQFDYSVVPKHLLEKTWVPSYCKA